MLKRNRKKTNSVFVNKHVATETKSALLGKETSVTKLALVNNTTLGN